MTDLQIVAVAFLIVAAFFFSMGFLVGASKEK